MERNEILELIGQRHSVRRYQQTPIKEETKKVILEYLEDLNQKSGLDIRYVENTKHVYGTTLLKILESWSNPPPAYFAFLGEKTQEIEEKCGYYGEELVLFLQSIGLNTCWVGLFKDDEVEIETKKPVIVTIAVGYGEDNGRKRRSKEINEVSSYAGTMPDWFSDGVTCALLAPTARNKQAFQITGEGNNVQITYQDGHFSNVDLGIVKYHFEQGAGKDSFEWKA